LGQTVSAVRVRQARKHRHTKDRNLLAQSHNAEFRSNAAARQGLTIH
jgi:hypothetical protein